MKGATCKVYRTPITDEELARMKVMCRSTIPGTVELAEAYKNLPRCIAEIERLKEELKQDVVQGPDAPAEFRHEGER